MARGCRERRVRTGRGGWRGKVAGVCKGGSQYFAGAHVVAGGTVCLMLPFVTGRPSRQTCAVAQDSMVVHAASRPA